MSPPIDAFKRTNIVPCPEHTGEGHAPGCWKREGARTLIRCPGCEDLLMVFPSASIPETCEVQALCGCGFSKMLLLIGHNLKGGT